MKIKNITVIGSGTMGHGIAQLCAESGLKVNIYDISLENLNKGFENIKKNLSLLIDNGKLIKEEAEDILKRISLVSELKDAVCDVQLVIECIAENLVIKQKVYGELDSLCDPSVILASNTSGLSPSDISKYLKHPERMVVAHFWCPPELIPLVEVVPGEKTSKEVVEKTAEWITAIGKQPVKMKKECLGFIGNRMQLALLREAMYIVEQGFADIEEVDKAVEYGLGRRLPVTGPLCSADLGGLDIFNNISTYLFKDLCNSTEPSKLLKDKVEAGNLGSKSGKGFYDWNTENLEKKQKERADVLLYFLKKDEKNK
ncbi:3-hydroxyacyl-CoA dehydrogenase family protein [Clostridium algoriphilum]|uniref:3-hydroxyacyl-CoA dehydrogenase family protein n=1 Tax=Clostridium algoriphilum TaxID=198347 RepID=UPI001CF44AD4|nr:3-hydroxyacyl-CoA dehydrogenase family protein [Clostridium algoriphilum]MCB2294754.1 3-hydroxyacyl-CoA dehydrogenase family protein [Clostridium algoriphilum]